MKKIYLILALIVTTLFVSCEAFQETTYQLYYDSFSSADQIKRIELREFNQEEGNYDNKRTIQLNIGEKSDIYDVSSDIEFVEVMIVSQYSVEQEKYHINICYLNKGEENIIRLSSLK
ncbi:MAG: hypothetical protein U0L57_07640 [Bacteroidales bacterium]|nr:hypothetical protein [Bacteroidales bacterium]